VGTKIEKTVYTGSTLFFRYFLTTTPICHLPAAGAKRGFHENGVLRSKDVASGNIF
jgi:hypothetical protein